VNRGDDTHSTTARDGSWDKQMAPGEKAGKKFSNPGTYRYYCTFHDGMRGKIIVT
jgi:plastocyanin